MIRWKCALLVGGCDKFTIQYLDDLYCWRYKLLFGNQDK